MSSDELSLEGGLFDEPDDFRPKAPEPHFTQHTRVSGEKVDLRLVGSSPLWGHLLWNAGIYTANYIDNHPDLVRGKRVLELGAAAALPSLISGLNGADLVVSTDYPDADLLHNIQYNVDHSDVDHSKIKVKGYIWGADVRQLVFSGDDAEWPQQLTEDDKFDLIILSDVVFNHTEHHKLLDTCRQALKKSGRALVVFSPHRAHLLEDDLRFFETCYEHELRSERIELVTWKPMFEEDDETAPIRARVYLYFLYPEW